MIAKTTHMGQHLVLAWKYRQHIEVRNTFLSVALPKWVQLTHRFLTKKRYFQTSNKHIIDLFSKIYDVVSNKEWADYRHHSVYDHYGPIDTLGWVELIGKHHGSFSCELSYKQWLNIGRVYITYYIDSRIVQLKRMK